MSPLHVERKCSVRFCGKPESDILFKLPTDSEQRDKWICALDLDRNLKDLRVCGAHFVKSDFAKSGKKLKRSAGIVPSRNLPVRLYFTVCHFPKNQSNTAKSNNVMTHCKKPSIKNRW